MLSTPPFSVNCKSRNEPLETEKLRASEHTLLDEHVLQAPCQIDHSLHH